MPVNSSVGVLGVSVVLTVGAMGVDKLPGEGMAPAAEGEGNGETTVCATSVTAEGDDVNVHAPPLKDGASKAQLPVP